MLHAITQQSLERLKTLEWLDSSDPGILLHYLYHSGKLQEFLPEVACLYGVPQRAKHHPEVDTGAHIELCLTVAADMKLSRPVRIAVLLHDLGKGVTPAIEWPSHHNHEHEGLPWVRRVIHRLALRSYEAQLALTVCRWHLWMHRVFEHRPQTVVKYLDQLFLKNLDQCPTLLLDFCDACLCDARGRLGLQDTLYPQADFLKAAFHGLLKLPQPDGLYVNTKAAHELHHARQAFVQNLKTDMLPAKERPAPAHSTQP